MKQLSADVVIINEKAASYVQELQDSLEALVRGSQLRLSPDSGGVSGKIFLLRGDLLTPDARAQLQAVARAVLLSRRGTLAEQIVRSQYPEPAERTLARPVRAAKSPDARLPQQTLQFFNGLGGFADRGREYVIALNEGLRTPEPWVNVIANPSFGFLVSESGSGFTWSLNSHENQLTSWSNDHVFDTPGEAIYIRDEATGEVWTPTALPVRDETASYQARHGQGYSRFLHGSHGISVWSSCNLCRWKIPSKFHGSRCATIRIACVAFPSRPMPNGYWAARAAQPRPTSSRKSSRSRRPSSRAAPGAANLAAVSRSPICAGSRLPSPAIAAEFFGRNGTAERPAALERGGPLSGKIGAALDPCAALQTAIELRPGARAEVVFFLGQTENRDQARDLLTALPHRRSR